MYLANGRKQIVILGGGSGGIVAATKLGRELGNQHDVILVDQRDEHIFMPAFLFLAKERIFLRQRYGGLLKGDFRRPTFAEQTDLPEKLADLSMVPRAHRGIRARRVADIYAKMLER